MKLKKFIPLTISALMASMISTGCSNGGGTKTLSHDEFMNEYTTMVGKRTTDITNYFSVTCKGKINEGQAVLDFSNGQDVLLDDDTSDKTVFGYLYGNIQIPLAFTSGKTLQRFLSDILPTGIKLNETYTKQEENLIYEIKDLTFVYEEDSIKNCNIKVLFDKYGLVNTFYLAGSYNNEDLAIDVNFSNYAVYEEYNEGTFKSFYKTAISNRAGTVYNDVLLTGYNEMSELEYEFDAENITYSYTYGGYCLNNNLTFDYGAFIGFASEEELEELLNNTTITDKKFGKTGVNNVLTYSWKAGTDTYITSIYFNSIGFANHFVIYKNYSKTNQAEIWVDLVDYQSAKLIDNLDKFAEIYTSLIETRGNDDVYICQYEETRFENDHVSKEFDGEALIYVEYDTEEKINGTYYCPLGEMPLGFDRKEEFKESIQGIKDGLTDVKELYTSTRTQYVLCITGKDKEDGNSCGTVITFNKYGFISSVIVEESTADTTYLAFVDVDYYQFCQETTQDNFISSMNVKSKSYNRVDAILSVNNHGDDDPQFIEYEDISLVQKDGQIKISGDIEGFNLYAGFTSQEGLKSYLYTLGDHVSYYQNNKNNDLILWYKDTQTGISYAFCYDKSGLLFSALQLGENSAGDFANSIELHNYTTKI